MSAEKESHFKSQIKLEYYPFIKDYKQTLNFFVNNTLMNHLKWDQERVLRNKIHFCFMLTLKSHSLILKYQTNTMCFLTSSSSRTLLLIIHADRAFGRLKFAWTSSCDRLYFNIVTYFQSETENWMRKNFYFGNLLDLEKSFHSACLSTLAAERLLEETQRI